MPSVVTNPFSTPPPVLTGPMVMQAGVGAVPVAATAFSLIGSAASSPISSQTLAQPAVGNITLGDIANLAMTGLATALGSFSSAFRTPIATTPVLPDQTAVVNQLNQQLNPGNDPEIARMIQISATDPDVLKLMQTAAAKGTRISFGATQPNVNGFYQPRDTNRDGRSDTGNITIGNRLKGSPEALDTFIHELGHAADPENGNSLREEARNEVFATAKAEALNRQFTQGYRPKTLNLAQIFRDTIALYRRNEPNLAQDNGSLASFANLGVGFSFNGIA